MTNTCVPALVDNGHAWRVSFRIAAVERQLALFVGEVSNAEFKEFVDAGGYREPRFWVHPIVKNGDQVPTNEAVKTFVDSTGELGSPVFTAKRLHIEAQGRGAAAHPGLPVSVSRAAERHACHHTAVLARPQCGAASISSRPESWL